MVGDPSCSPQWLCVCIRRGKVVGNTEYSVPKIWPCLGRLHGGSRKGVDDEQQLLMRWGSTLRPFTARIAATSNQILHQKYLLASGIWVHLLSSLNHSLLGLS